jgi:hypothetical protein
MTLIDTRSVAEAISAFRDTLTDNFANYKQREIEALIGKWAWYMQDSIKLPNGKTVEMKPVDPKQWAMLAMLLENQMLANPQPRTFWEATARNEISLPTKYTLPIIRDIFPQLIMNKICLVQPMPPSSGGTMQLFWKDTYREDDTDVNVTTANSLYSIHASDTTVPKRMKIEITSQTVTATQEMLMASWPQRVEEDLRGVMGLDIDQELIADMGAEIMRELEQRVVATMVAGATAGNVDFDEAVPEDFTGSYTDNYQRLFHAFIDAEAKVRESQYRQCNYIVAGNTVLAMMDKANWFGGFSRDDTSGAYRTAVEFIGKRGRWDVYFSPYIEDTQALISFYPEFPLRGGYIWAPYIPFTAMPKIYAEAKAYNDETPGGLVANDLWTRRVRSRNAQYYCQPAMFATVTVKEAS